MASRAPVGRPGARFAQFKLVLLGECFVVLVDIYEAYSDDTLCSGESAVGKVL